MSNLFRHLKDFPRFHAFGFFNHYDVIARIRIKSQKDTKNHETTSPISIETFATTQPLLQHHRTHLVELTFNVDFNVKAVIHTSDTDNITKIAITPPALPIQTKTHTMPPITAPTPTTTNSPIAYPMFSLSVHTAQTQSQRTRAHPSRVGYQSYSTLYLRDHSRLTHRSQSSILSLLLTNVSFCGFPEPPVNRTFCDFHAERRVLPG